MARFALGEQGRGAVTPVRVVLALLLVLVALFVLELHPATSSLRISPKVLSSAPQICEEAACDCSQCPLDPAAAAATDATPAAAETGSSAAVVVSVAADAGTEPGACPPCPDHEPKQEQQKQEQAVKGKQKGSSAAGAGGSTLESQYDAALVRRLWGHKHFVQPRWLRRGIHSLGDPARMRRFVHKLLSGQAVSVSAVGGSVTAGQGAGPDTAFNPRLWEFIRNVSPKANHTLKHAAFGGSTSGIFSVCVNDMVQADADMVIVEFSANDNYEAGIFRDPDRLAFERLLRKLLDWPSRPAVVLLHHYAWFAAGGGDGKPGDYLHNAENDFNVLGQYYGLPLLSVRAAAYQLMLQDVKGYQATVWRRDHEDTTVDEDLFYFDFVHPQEDSGYRVLADLLVGLIQETAVGLGRRPAGEEDERDAEDDLPPPVVPGNFQRRSSTCLLQRAFQTVVTKQRGFEWRNERPGADLASEKWGWIGEKPGSWAELEIDTTTDLQGSLRPEKNEVVLSYLKSYELMGRAKVECVSGCKCEPTDFDGYWAEQSSLSELHRFQATPHHNCRLRVTVAEGSSSPDGGTKVKLVGIMVVEGGGSVDAMGIQLDMFANRGSAEEKMPRG